MHWITGIKCYYDGEDVTHLVKLSPSGDGDKLAEELNQILPLVVKEKDQGNPSNYTLWNALHIVPTVCIRFHWNGSALVNWGQMIL